MLVVIVRDEQTPLFSNQNFQSSISSLGFFRITPNESEGRRDAASCQFLLSLRRWDFIPQPIEAISQSSRLRYPTLAHVRAHAAADAQ